jgi:uncharacterized membrane protein
MKRIFYLDILRGIAILLMVIDHAYDWWLDEAGHATFLASSSKFLGTLAAPTFLFLVGVGISISGRRSRREGKDIHEISVYLFKRGLQIILLGYLLNLFVYYANGNTKDIFAIDVLQTIGVSIWLSVPLFWLPTALILVVTLALGVAGQFAGSWVLPAWLSAYLSGTGGIGYFPLALWLPYCYLGLGIGKIVETIHYQENQRKVRRFMLSLSVMGTLGFLSTLIIPPAWGYRHPRPIFTTFSLAIIFWLMAGIWLWSEVWRKRGIILRTLQSMGKSSLMLYSFHLLVGYRFFYLLGWVKGRSWRGEYGLFSPITATFLLVGMILAMLAAISFRNYLRDNQVAWLKLWARTTKD